MKMRLFLAAGESVAPGADHGVVAVGQGADQVVDLGGSCGVFDVRVGRGGLGVAEVFADRGVQQVRFLADHADDLDQGDKAQPADVDAVDGDGAVGGVVEAGDERGEGGLA